MTQSSPAANNQPNLNVPEKTERVEQDPMNDPIGSVPKSLERPFVVCSPSKKYLDKLIEDVEKQRKQLAEQERQLAQLIQNYSHGESKREQVDKTRTRLVESLLANFKIVMLAILALIFVASLGGSRVDKELIQHSIPLLLNMMTGLIGAVLGYYFSGNSKNNRS
jgi:hypothetical protein